MSTKIQRYNQDEEYPHGLHPAEDGIWMLYQCHVSALSAAEAKAERMERALEQAHARILELESDYKAQLEEQWRDYNAERMKGINEIKNKD